jgi:hypothetical protein
MIVSCCIRDMPRRRRSQLFINMMYAMGCGKDQEEQKRESGTPTQAGFGESELFSKSHHRFDCNPSCSCLAAQAPGVVAEDDLISL